tara:strand:- start:17899 stop:19977 length:2079 start_codon:yes stop_codon:yes gene_type:complete
MKPRLVYISQFRDACGYAVAARGYLRALEKHLQINPDSFDLKVYNINAENTSVKRLTHNEEDILSKYEFTSETEIEKFCSDPYIVVWHLPAPMYTLAGLYPADHCWKTFTKVVKGASKNINLTVWETKEPPEAWLKMYYMLKTEAVIMPCNFNKSALEETSKIKTYKLPHVIDFKNTKSIPIRDIEKEIKDKFVVFSMSQWIPRKGFDKLVEAYTMEFGKQEDTVLVIKTYLNVMHDFLEQVPLDKQAQHIGAQISQTKSRVFLSDARESKAKVVLVCDLLPSENISWLYDKTDLFALMTRGEGFGLTVAEAIDKKKPVLVPKASAYLDFTNEESSFYVDGSWEPCHSSPELHSDLSWFEPSTKSARLQLREAYNLWKNGKLAQVGQSAHDYLSECNFTEEKVGQDFFDILKEESKNLKPTDADLFTNKSESVFKEKIASLRWSLSSVAPAEVATKNITTSKVNKLTGQFAGEDCYILGCGPSLSNYSPDFLREKLKDKLVIALKQAYNYAPEIVDIHMFNSNNVQAYEYTKSRPLVIGSSAENLPTTSRGLWSTKQEFDIFFFMPDDKNYANALCNARNFNDYTLDKTIYRPWGPGMMYETVLHTALHLGVENIYTIGWDMENPGTTTSHHFYEDTNKIIRKPDLMKKDEIVRNIEASKDVHNWLKQKGVNLYIGSEGSHVHSDVPRKILA